MTDEKKKRIQLVRAENIFEAITKELNHPSDRQNDMEKTLSNICSLVNEWYDEKKAIGYL